MIRDALVACRSRAVEAAAPEAIERQCDAALAELDRLETALAGSATAGFPFATLAVIAASSHLTEAYHDAYAAHHGDRGPVGCPCCAEFFPRVAEAIERLGTAVAAWEFEDRLAHRRELDEVPQ